MDAQGGGMLRGATDDQACSRIWDLMERAEPDTGFDCAGDGFFARVRIPYPAGDAIGRECLIERRSRTWAERTIKGFR